MWYMVKVPQASAEDTKKAWRKSWLFSDSHKGDLETAISVIYSLHRTMAEQPESILNYQTLQTLGEQHLANTVQWGTAVCLRT